MALRSLLISLFAASAVLGSPAPNLSKRALSVYSSCTNSNEIALTFDDGPYIYLRQISDAFTNAGAKATFFFNGNNWDCIYNPDRVSDVQYAFKAGHMLGSHTWSHADLLDLSNAQIVDGMYRVEEALSRIVGVLPGFLRPPYGDYNSNIQSIAFSRNQNLAMWDWDTGDADGNTTSQSEAVYNQIANAHLSNALVLEHETEESTANTLVPYAINLFQSKGYKLVTLAECVGTQPYAAVGVPQQQSSSWTCDGTPDPGDACGGSIACKSGTPTLDTGSGTTTTTTTTTTSTGSSPTGTSYNIHPSVDSSKCVGILGGTYADGTAVDVYDCNGSNTQKWQWNGSALTSVNPADQSQWCLDAGVQSSMANGVKMKIWQCYSGLVQQTWTPTTSGAVKLSVGGFCLDLTGGSTANQNVLQIWTCGTGNTNQNWNFVSV